MRKKNLNKLTKNLGRYLDQDQLEQVKKAYFFAANAHSGQFRVSGDPYVTHPLAVAEILGTLKMDQDCLSAAMLHDVIEDSGIPKTFLKKEFNKKDVESFFKNVTKQHEKINILVNNVGRSEPGDPEVMDYDVWREQFSTNLDTAFFAIKQIIPTMKKNDGGSIVNISSVAGMRYVGKPQVGYSASKAALMQMTKTTAIIHAENKIRLNCVVPGLMHTPLVKRLANKYADGKYDEFVKTRNNQVPMKKMGSSFDVANAVLFLASDEAKYITGTEIVVDGGLTATTP